MNLNFTNGDYCVTSFSVEFILAKTGYKFISHLELFRPLGFQPTGIIRQYLKDLSKTVLGLKIRLMQLNL
jgi:hypothetical protein